MSYSGFGHAEVSFLAMGDSPYTDEGFYLIEKELKNIPRNSKFLIHLGDIKRKERGCAEENYGDFKNLLKQSPIPVFIVPGDNDYDFCKDKSKAKQLWDQYISEFEKHWELEFLVKRQYEQRENFSFLLESTLFIGVNLFEKRSRDTIKFNKIMRNNIFWIKENIKQHEKSVSSLIIFAHDYSGLINEDNDYLVCNNINLTSWAKENYESKKYFSGQFIALANEFKKPILYIQGNHHCLMHDFPYKEAKNIERIVVDRVEKTPLVQITVNDDEFLLTQRKNNRIDFFIKDANLGDVWAQYFMGLEYLKIKDYKNAKKWFTKASSKHFSPAQVSLIKMLQEGKGGLGDTGFNLAFKLLEPLILYDNLSNDFIESLPDVKNSLSFLKRIVQFKKEIIRNARYKSYFTLGLMHEKGIGTIQNYKKALSYYKKSSEGNTLGNSYLNIANLYFNGLGIDKNYHEAKKWLKKSAQLGVPMAKFMLGTIYMKGMGVKINYRKARNWFSQVMNHAPSVCKLGVLYFQGLGVKKDYKIAISYFKKAAILGNKEAKKILESSEIKAILESLTNTP